MKKHVILCGMIALGVACAPLVMADEPTGTESHHFVKDSAITTKVKAKLAEAHVYVDPDQGRYRCGRRGMAERPGSDSGRE